MPRIVDAHDDVGERARIDFRLVALVGRDGPSVRHAAAQGGGGEPQVHGQVERQARAEQQFAVDQHDAAVVPATGFYRPASVRLEHGRTDPDARYTDWLDVGALAREVLDPLGPGGSGEYLPVLWDLERDRATRARRLPMPPGGVLLVPGSLLQGLGLAFDVVVHLRVTPAARRRLVAGHQAWMLPAYDRYDDEVGPVSLADAVVLADHPDRPALVLAGRFAG